MRIVKALKSILFIYVLLCAAIYLFQRSLIYQPTEETVHGFNTLKISTENHTVEAIETGPKELNFIHAGVIIYFGGNAENVAYTAVDFEHKFPQHKTYLLKYRGYSGTPGDASEANLFTDALILVDHLKLKSKNITVIGRSLGSGIAAFVASERKIDQLILVTPFDSIRNLGQQLLPAFPIKWLLKDHFDSKSRAGKFTFPTMVLMAENDEVIPAKNTLSLIKSIPKKYLKFVSVEAKHNDLDLHADYFDSIKDFIN